MIFRKKGKTALSWSDITLGQFEKMTKLDSKDENYLFNFAAIAFNIDFDDFADLPLRVVNEYMERVRPLLTTSPKANKIGKEIRINDKPYTLTDSEDMTVAQFIDFQASVGICREKTSEFLSIVLIPQGKAYNEGYKRADIIEEIKKMSVEDALGISRFFFLKWKRSLMLSLFFSQSMLRIRKWAERKTLTEKEKMDLEQGMAGLRLQEKMIRRQIREFGFR